MDRILVERSNARTVCIRGILGSFGGDRFVRGNRLETIESEKGRVKVFASFGL